MRCGGLVEYEMKRPEFTSLTNDSLADTIGRNIVSMDAPEHDALALHIGRMTKWKEVVRMAGSIAVVYGRTCSVVELIQIGVAMGVRQGWNACGDAAELQDAMKSIGELMTDQELAEIRKEIKTIGL